MKKFKFISLSSFFTGNESLFYDFSNPYVCFAENLAEWYSCEGVLKGPYGNLPSVKYGSLYKNVVVFNNLKSNINLTSNNIMQLIDDYDIITFQEFYNALIKKYPGKKAYIQKSFKDSNSKTYGDVKF